MGANSSRKKRVPVALNCTVCGNRTKKTTKSPATEGQITLKKFCRVCGTHTVHIDSK